MDPRIPIGPGQPVAPPLFTSSVYRISDLDTLDRISDGQAAGFIYARDAHPNALALAKRLAELEGAAWGVVTSSGMGAVSAALLAGVKAGDRIIASDQLYGRSAQLLGDEFIRFGISATFVDTNDHAALKSAFAASASTLLVETISNPLLRVADLRKLAAISQEHGARLIVDNTFATPILCRPIEFGADLVIESLTKLIGGHSDLTLGAVVGGNTAIANEVRRIVSVWGFNASPFDCWMAQRSLSTIELRVVRSAANAKTLAEWLVDSPKVGLVIYPGLACHPDAALSKEMFSNEPGNMIAIELQGGRSAVDAFICGPAGIAFCPSLGDTQTTISYPAGTSHRNIDSQRRVTLGITDGMMRISVGIEPIAEILAAFERGLAKL